MTNKFMLKRIGISIAYIFSICVGLLIIYHVIKWIYYLHLIHELTGAVSNFALYLTIGVILLLESIVENSKTMLIEGRKEIGFIIVSAIFLVIALILMAVFIFTDEILNFSMIFLLEIPGLFLIYLPRLINAKKRMDIVKNKDEWET